MEGILYKVPMGECDADGRSVRLGSCRLIVQWPAGFDQPYVANELDRLGVAKELIQTRGGSYSPPWLSSRDIRLTRGSGPSIQRPVARDGRIVMGKAEAIRAEMIGLFEDFQGPVIKAMRRRTEEMSEVLKKDRESGGSYEAVVRLSQLGQ